MANDTHTQCEDCGKCRVSEREEWCAPCDYWGCEGGPDCADATPATSAWDLLGIAPNFTGGLSVDQYMDEQRSRK